MIKTKNTAKEIMVALSNTYKKKGISTQVQLQLFLTEFERTIFELRSARGKMDDSEIVSQLLSSMPESYQAVTTAIDIMFCQDETKVTVDFVKSKLLMEESRQAKLDTETNTKDAVFTGYKKKWNRKGDRKERKQNTFPFKCHGCGVVGHKKYECPKMQKSNFKANVAENVEEEEEEIAFLTAPENSVSITEEFTEVKFIIDSGATNHLVNRNTGAFLRNKKDIKCAISVAKKGEVLEATVQGNLEVILVNGKNACMKNVWMCDGLMHNLLSVRKLEEKGFKIVFQNKEALIIRNEEIVLKGKLCGNLYVLSLRISHNDDDTAYVTTENMLLHRRMGHSSYYPAPGVCEVCLQGKQARQPFRSIEDERKAKRILEVVSSDVCGPISPPTHDGKSYYVSFIDIKFKGTAKRPFIGRDSRDVTPHINTERLPLPLT
ncbi:hypothetical protein QE152_g38852 [Popillia japonica]|uniref:CCHC-type domain-containing protein n=1 Tax=Popillia japonica TaxID=7064 RepID=A0AAW1HW37_POPJA